MLESTAITAADFDRLFLQYKQAFVDIAFSYVRERMVAEDLVTDSFLTFWSKRAEVTDENIPAYILTIVKNKCLSWLRSESQHQRVHETLARKWGHIHQATLHSLEHSDPKTLFLTEVESIVQAQLSAMPVTMRRIFIDHRYHDMTYREIAATYGLSTNQVDFEIRKATRILRLALKDYLLVSIIILCDKMLNS